jgi:hypothetical protein
MSWIIERLINDSLEIGKGEFNPDDDDYNDLFLVEAKIKELAVKGLLSSSDLDIIAYMRNGKDTSESTKGEKWVLSKKYSEICDRIAFYIGGYFTDDGYIAYIANKYKLDTEQIETLRAFIKSQFKHKIIRKPLNFRRKISKND